MGLDAQCLITPTVHLRKRQGQPRGDRPTFQYGAHRKTTFSWAGHMEMDRGHRFHDIAGLD